jgi:hypothetical protein
MSRLDFARGHHVAAAAAGVGMAIGQSGQKVRRGNAPKKCVALTTPVGIDSPSDGKDFISVIKARAECRWIESKIAQKSLITQMDQLEGKPLSAPSPQKTTPNPKNLASLGAERLADLLMELAAGGHRHQAATAP